MTSPHNSHPLRKVIGLSAALTTPFTKGGAIDWALYGAHAKGLLARGVDVVTAFGTTGEGASIAAPVRAELFTRMDRYGVAADRIVVAAYGPAAGDAAAAARLGFEAGCAAVLMLPPFYYPDPGEEALYRWFSRVIETAGGKARNVILYSIPQVTGIAITPALVTRLRTAFGAVIGGVKESSGNWQSTKAIIAAHKDLAILVGHEGHLAQAVRLGASGAISGVANFAPELVGKLVGGEDDARIEPLLAAILAHPVTPAVKAAVVALGGDAAFGRPLAPLMALNEAKTRALGQAIKTALAGTV